ncbi:MAG: cupin domain-containing protein [Actinobacteria bacterium]|nr:cupin domain-containing protein [Actinomycetota bacterium]
MSAFGIDQLEFPPGREGPEHDHKADGQEEVYAIVKGVGTIRVDGEEHELRPGQFVFLSPESPRVPGIGMSLDLRRAPTITTSLVDGLPRAPK